LKIAALYLVVVLVAMLCLPGSYKLNRTWRGFTDGGTQAERAITAGLPIEAVAFIESVKLIREGRAEESLLWLNRIDQELFPELKIDEMEAIWRSD
jgi:hypothetical protein